MDCAPLNLAHFHERRSERFLRHHRYDDAIAAMETSLLYLQDAYKNVSIQKSIEVLNTQRWDFERKLRQIEIRKKQHGISKMKDFAAIKETSPMLPLRPEQSGSAQSVSKAIDKTVQDFDAKFITTSDPNTDSPKAMRRDTAYANEPQLNQAMTKSEPQVTQTSTDQQNQLLDYNDDEQDIPALAPLELPTFDFNMFTSSSAPSLANYVGFSENYQKPN